MVYHPLVSVIICSLNGAERLPACLDSLEKSTYPHREVIVVDNGSADETGTISRGYLGVKVLRAERNLGFAGGNNLGIAVAKGDIFLLLNDDTIVDPGWLEPIVEASLTLPDWGVLGSLLIYPDGETVQHAGAYIERNGLTKHYGYRAPLPNGDMPVTRVPYVTGAAFAINRHVIGLLGPLDARYFPIYFEETDLCFRAAEIGFACYLVPQSRVIHLESRTTECYSPGFLRKYHRNRWRFIIKNFPRRDLLRAVKAEIRWLFDHHPSDQYLPLISAAFANFVRLPRTLLDRKRSREQIWMLRHRLQTHRWDPLEILPSPFEQEASAQ